MISRWHQHIKDDRDKEAFVLTIKNSTVALSRLLEILKEDEEEILRAPLPDYSDAAWSFRQAHRNGELARIRKVKDLLNFTREKDI